MRSVLEQLAELLAVLTCHDGIRIPSGECRHHRPPTHFLRTTRTPLLFGVLVRRFLVTDGEVWERRFGSRP